MTNAEKAKYKRAVKSNYINLVAHTVESLEKQKNDVLELSTEFNTPARLAKLIIIFAATTRLLCESNKIEKYPISTFKVCLFRCSNYDFLTGIVDEAEAVEQTILIAVNEVAEFLKPEEK